MLNIFSIYNPKIPKFFSQLISYFKLEVEINIFFIENI